MTTPFAVFALPRSRTAWLSRFLTEEPWVAVHDAMVSAENVWSLRALLAMPHTGIVETGLGFAAPVIRRFIPDCRFAVIRRPVADVEKSLAAKGVVMVAGELAKMDGYLDEIEALPGTVSVTFDELGTEEGCRRISEHCVGSFDAERFRRMNAENIQVDFAARIKSLFDNAARYQGLVREFRSLMSPVDVQREGWDSFYPECLSVVAEHAAEIGEIRPEMPFDPDYDLAAALDRDGRLGLITARAAGRLVGYLFFAVSRSIESRTVLCATQGACFVLPEFRQQATGPRMFKAGIEEMKRMGVKMVYLRHGPRGSSKKLGSLYRRMGAEHTGNDYTLWIG